MFTDWTMTDSHYFYIRGVIYGIVAATIFWKALIPWLQTKFKKNKKGGLR